MILTRTFSRPPFFSMGQQIEKRRNHTGKFANDHLPLFTSIGVPATATREQWPTATKRPICVRPRKNSPAFCLWPSPQAPWRVGRRGTVSPAMSYVFAHFFVRILSCRCMRFAPLFFSFLGAKFFAHRWAPINPYKQTFSVRRFLRITDRT